MLTHDFKFISTPEKGEVSALLMQPADATHLLVLGHGASSNMRSPMLQTLAETLANHGIATLRYNFPYSEKGGGRNSNEVCMQTVRSAVAAAQKSVDLPVMLGGHSFSGRISSMAQAESPIPNVKALMFFSFPLHPAGKRGTERADHLTKVTLPMLFLSGTRDALAELDLLQPVIENLGSLATLHLLDTADHGFKILKKARKTDEDVFVELAKTVHTWSKHRF